MEELNRNKKSLTPWVFAIVSFLGFTDAAYLSAKAILGETPTCVIFSGCDTVTTSVYSHLGPIPIAVFGALFYLAVFVLSLVYLDRRSPKILKIILGLSIPAFL